MKRFVIKDKQCGNVIDEFESLAAAESALKLYELDDKKNGVYEPDFYEIKEIEKWIDTELQ